MSFRASESNSSSEGQSFLQARKELTASQQIYDGQLFWIVKDPMSLRYYRFSREEYFIIKLLQQGVTMDELKQAHREEFKTDRLTNSELSGFIRQLAQKNIVSLEQANRDEMLYNASRRQWRAKFMMRFSNFMFLKVPLFDPDKLLNRIMPYIRFFWTKTFFLFYLLLLCLAAGLVVRRWNDFSDMFQSYFFTVRNIPLLFLTIWLIKALHEFGHAFTCKNYGGEIHEMGWLFLVFTPFFYCNVTDSWTFPEKRHRLLVTAGGIMTELVFASLAAILWYFTDVPGFIHALSFNIIIACSFGTILFNANPLLKYDGYYILMDLIEVPNLRQRSSDFIRNLFIKHLLGGQTGQLPEEHRFRYVFPFYSLAAFVYRWFIMFAILFMVYHLLEKIHLTWLGRLIVTFSAVTMIIYPVSKTTSGLFRQRSSLGVSSTRMIVLLSGLVLFILAALFWPQAQHVTLNFILEPVQTHWVGADVPGTLQWTSQISDSVWLDSQTDQQLQIAQLSNHELLCDQKQLSIELEKLERQIDEYRARRRSNEVERLKEVRQSLQNELNNVNELIANLEVNAPFEGQVLMSNRVLKQEQGHYISRGMPLLLVADTRELTAKVWVPEKTWRIFKRANELGQDVELMLYAFSDQEFRGRVTAVSSHREDNMGEFGEKLALSNKVGGEVLTEFDPVTKQEKPMEAVYEVTITLDQATVPASVRPYMSGRARIDCGKSTLYQWGRDSLLRFISPEIRL